MTFQELMNNWLWKEDIKQYVIKIVNDTNNEPNNIKYDTNNIDNVLDLLELSFETIFNFDLLYNEFYVKECVKRILKTHIFKLMSDFKIMLSYIDKDLQDKQNERKGNNITKNSYSGYDVDNQEGNFNNVINEYSEIVNNPFTFYSYIRRKNIIFGDIIIKEIMDYLRVIY